MDVTSKTTFDQRGDVTAMIYVGMGQDGSINAICLERQIAVPLESLCAMPLKQPTLQQDAPPVDMKKVLRTRHRTGSTPNRYLHRTLLNTLALMHSNVKRDRSPQMPVSSSIRY
jgi:hypothetical protein